MEGDSCIYFMEAMSSGHINIIIWNINGCSTPITQKKYSPLLNLKVQILHIFTKHTSETLMKL